MIGNHLLGIYEKAFDAKDDWKTRLTKAKKLGFDFLEISIDETDERLSRLYWSDEEIENLRRLCYECGLPIQSMCLSVHRRFPFGSEDPAIREKAHEIMNLAIDFAYKLGIRVIQLAGYDVYYEPSTPETVKRFKEAMDWSTKQAARKQVMLATEIMDTNFYNNITKHLTYERDIRAPWYRVYPDFGNISAWPENDVEYEFENGVGSIVGIHLKDTIAVTDTFEGKFKCVPFGTGCVNFPRRFRQMEDLKYTGPYMIEMWHQPGENDLENVKAAKEWLTAQYEAGMKEKC